MSMNVIRNSWNRLTRIFTDMSVANKLLICYMLVVFAPILLFGTVYLKGLSDTLDKEYIYERSTSLSQLANTLSLQIAQVDYINNSLFSKARNKSIIWCRMFGENSQFFLPRFLRSGDFSPVALIS